MLGCWPEKSALLPELTHLGVHLGQRRTLLLWKLRSLLYEMPINNRHPGGAEVFRWVAGVPDGVVLKRCPLQWCWTEGLFGRLMPFQAWQCTVNPSEGWVVESTADGTPTVPNLERPC